MSRWPRFHKRIENRLGELDRLYRYMLTVPMGHPMSIDSAYTMRQTTVIQPGGVDTRASRDRSSETSSLPSDIARNLMAAAGFDENPNLESDRPGKPF